VGIVAAISMMFGGYIAGQVGINIIFYAVAAIIVISTLLLFYIKETS
jgi:flagellar motor component MotA